MMTVVCAVQTRNIPLEKAGLTRIDCDPVIENPLLKTAFRNISLPFKCPLLPTPYVFKNATSPSLIS